jgi:hypothetical protein
MGVLEDSGWLLSQPGAEAGEVQMVCVHFVKTTTHPMMFVTFFKFPLLVSCLPLHILCAKFTLVQRQNVTHAVNFAHFLSKVCTIARMNVWHMLLSAVLLHCLLDTSLQFSIVKDLIPVGNNFNNPSPHL